MDGFGEKVYAFAPLLPSIKSKSKSDTEDKNKKHQKIKFKHHQPTITWIVIWSIFSALARKRWERTSILLIFHKSFLFYFQFRFISCFCFLMFGFSDVCLRDVWKNLAKFRYNEKLSAVLQLIFSTHSIFNLLSGHCNIFQKPHIHKPPSFLLPVRPRFCLRILKRLYFMQIHIASTFQRQKIETQRPSIHEEEASRQEARNKNLRAVKDNGSHIVSWAI